eukprot:354174-Chlamydomonas_euryale.AAC.3
MLPGAARRLAASVCCAPRKRLLRTPQASADVDPCAWQVARMRHHAPSHAHGRRHARGATRRYAHAAACVRMPPIDRGRCVLLALVYAWSLLSLPACLEPALLACMLGACSSCLHARSLLSLSACLEPALLACMLGACSPCLHAWSLPSLPACMQRFEGACDPVYSCYHSPMHPCNHVTIRPMHPCDHSPHAPM